ncbi:PLP-dependent transferase [Poronia punctata]|nr:PLP-dependent transferase [Poronia punctata]
MDGTKMNGTIHVNGHGHMNGKNGVSVTVTPTTDRVNYPPMNVGGIGLADVGTGTVVGRPPSGEPHSFAGIAARREKAGKLVAGTAAYADSDMFKSPQAFSQPKAKRWDYRLTQESLSRKPCAIKQAAQFLKIPGIMSLGGGLPSSENFPFESLSMQISHPPLFDEASSTGPESVVSIGKNDIRDKDAVFDLSVGLNYGQSVGSAQMLRWVTEHTELVSRPRYADWKCALTMGNTGTLDTALRMLCNRGDSILAEEFSFSTALETMTPLGLHIFGVKVDDEGLCPDALDNMLENWDEKARGGAPKPKVIYTVPTGGNPTGATMGVQRRKDVYKVCSKHDVFILEDDPYYYIQMPWYSSQVNDISELELGRDELKAGMRAKKDKSPEYYLESLLPTLLSLDVDGRVLRMDSFSKVMVPGARMGWVTGCDQLIERFIRQQESGSQGPSGFSQVILHKVLDETWGHEGFVRWLTRLADEYTRRRNALLDACEKHLPKNVVSWSIPVAGMFHWIRVDPSSHPEKGKKSLLEIEEEIFNTCIENKVLLCRGSWFSAEKDVELSSLFFRTTFATATAQEMDTAIQRFGAAIRKSYGINE